jgi:hypothetical protein
MMYVWPVATNCQQMTKRTAVCGYEHVQRISKPLAHHSLTLSISAHEMCKTIKPAFHSTIVSIAYTGTFYALPLISVIFIPLTLEKKHIGRTSPSATLAFHHVTTVVSYPFKVTVKLQRPQTSLVILQGAHGRWRETIHYNDYIMLVPLSCGTMSGM